MRFGGPIFAKSDSPEAWIQTLKAAGYRAAYCPVTAEADAETVLAYADAARRADIVIAEVGAWSNPLSPDDAIRKSALESCKKNLWLADEIGSRCCVNIAGSRGTKWDGPSPLDLTDETFEMIVEIVREIIDGVAPARTFYTLETMPWMYPDSTESYLRLIRAIDRKSFAVHFDPVNLINSPARYFSNGLVIRDFVNKLGDHIKSCHAKDILLQPDLTVHLDEVRPGSGALDYRLLLSELARLEEDVPLMLEHLPDEKAYAEAASYIRQVAQEAGITL